MWEIFTTGKRRRQLMFNTTQTANNGLNGEMKDMQANKEHELDFITKTLKDLDNRPIWRGARVNIKHIPAWERNF